MNPNIFLTLLFFSIIDEKLYGFNPIVASFKRSKS